MLTIQRSGNQYLICMNPKQFLQIGGAVLLLVGVVGFFNIIGPTPDASIFGANWYFDNGENWAHLLLGVIGIVAAFILSDMYQKQLVLVLGVVGVLVGIYSIFSPVFLGANLENPADTLLHLVVGGWALFAALSKRGAMMA